MVALTLALSNRHTSDHGEQSAHRLQPSNLIYKI